MYPVFICEDDELQRKQIEIIVRNYLLFHNETMIVQCVTGDPCRLLMFIEEKKVNKGTYLLDILLEKEIDGIDLAEKIRKLDPQAKIIFITSEKHLAIKTIQRHIEPIGFIHKTSLEEMKNQIHKLLAVSYESHQKYLQNNQQVFSFTIGSSTYNLDYSDILYIEKIPNKRPVNLVTLYNTYSFYNSIKQLKKEHPSLIQASRSLLVNISNVKSINSVLCQLEFINGIKMYFALSRIKELKNAMNNVKNR